ncbi:HlyC/CorC family transporter [bacterium]|nr:HlyC/CorC family transporter [candidate division CSSED10-310 bacterium]
MIKLITVLAGLAAIVSGYYEVSLTRLNSAQLERILRIRPETDSFHGIRLSVVLLAMQTAAVFADLVFLLLLAILLIVPGWNPTHYLIFLLIGFAVQIVGRSFLPMVILFRERTSLKSIESTLFIACSYAFYPVVALIELISVQINRLLYSKTDEDRITYAEETIKSIINVGEKEGIFKEDDGEMLQSIVEFSETLVREVMTPRIDMQCIEIEDTLLDLVNLVITSGYSKIPVYRERIDEIVGILYAKDILQFWDNPRESVKIGEFMRSPYFIPETKKVRDLLREFQKEKMHMAVVVDEYGGVAGLVTIEDLLEEIVGEIHDEYDVEQRMIQSVSQDVWTVDAKIDLDELEEILDIEFPRDGYETLGGFLFDQLGRIPALGEIVHFRNFTIEILEADERRILKVSIYKNPAGDEVPGDRESNAESG